VAYAAHTPSVQVGDHGTVQLPGENEPQPDAFLRFDPVHGGTSRISEDDYLEGPPEFIVEVAASSVSYDLHDKRQVYQDSGVQEYLAVQVDEQRVDWFVLRQGVYAVLAPDGHGVLRSTVFPGLWLLCAERSHSTAAPATPYTSPASSRSTRRSANGNG